MLSRVAQHVSVGHFLSSNPTVWGVGGTLKFEPGKKEVQIPDVELLSEYRCTQKCTHKQNMDMAKRRVTNGSDNSGALSLRDACLGKPRSMNKRSFTPCNIDSRCKDSSGQGMKGGHAAAHKKQPQGKSTLMH